jgi:N-acyl-D-aspartate/D-glutamate deacylase
MSLDIVIRNAHVVDGTASPRFRASVGIDQGRIVEIDKGDRIPEGKIDINADGKLLTPGFFDIHRHSDWTLLVDSSAESAIEQGLTTEVVGNCGFGPAPAVDRKRVEQNILGHSAKHGIEIDWTTFGEYLDRLDRNLGINVVPLVAHGSIRTSAMGVADRPADQDEIKKMCYWVDEALDSGAFGLSAGLEYAPYQTSTTTEEIVALVKRVGERGGLYSTHTRYRIFNSDKGVAEAIQIARESGTRLQISHITPRIFARHMTEAVLESCDKAREEGLDVGFDIYPYEWAPGPLTELLPGWALEGSADDVVQRFRDDEFKRKVVREHRVNLCRWVQLDRWDKVIIVGAPKRPDVINKSIAQLAQEWGKDPWDVVFDLLAEAGTHYTDLTEITHTLDWEDILLTIRDPHCSFGSDSSTLSRKGPLKDEAMMPGCYGFVPRVFDEVVSSRKALSFEEAVRRLTSLPASQLGIWDRGIIRPGLVADLTLIDPKTFRDNTTWTDFYARPGGIDLVLISGKVAVENGRATGVRGGKLLRAKGGVA